MHFLGAVTKTRPMMIMTEFMPGGSLTDLLYGGGEARFSIWRAVQMALDMARALEYMHNRSPQVRGREGRGRALDFLRTSPLLQAIAHGDLMA